MFAWPEAADPRCPPYGHFRSGRQNRPKPHFARSVRSGRLSPSWPELQVQGRAEITPGRGCTRPAIGVSGGMHGMWHGTTGADLQKPADTSYFWQFRAPGP
jgi:hypothetical protein